MGQPAAKQGDTITAQDAHTVVSGSGATSLVPLPFSGPISGGVSRTVFVEKRAAAVVGSTANNTPPHIPPPGTSFKPPPPSNVGTVAAGSGTVFVDRAAAARGGDPATTCDETGPRTGAVNSTTTSVFLG